MRTRLELTAVTKKFGCINVLTQVWLQVRAGEGVGLVGVNGAGKTTMLRIAAGLVLPDSGSVRGPDGAAGFRYFGGEMTLPREVQARRWASLFGVTSQDRRPLGVLSRGSRQLYGLRVVLAGQADLVILDEPWEGLDPAGSAWLTEALIRLRESGAAVLVSSHRLHDLVASCSRFVLLESGRCRTISERDGGPRVDQLAQVVRATVRG